MSLRHSVNGREIIRGATPLSTTCPLEPLVLPEPAFAAASKP